MRVCVCVCVLVYVHLTRFLHVHTVPAQSDQRPAHILRKGRQMKAPKDHMSHKMGGVDQSIWKELLDLSNYRKHNKFGPCGHLLATWSFRECSLFLGLYSSLARIVGLEPAKERHWKAQPHATRLSRLCFHGNLSHSRNCARGRSPGLRWGREGRIDPVA